MTRLTSDIIEDISFTLEERDEDLLGKIGLSLKGLAVRALCPNDEDLDFGHIRVSAVPVSSGEGVIPTFSNSVSAVAQHLGMESMVTRKGDVAGLTEALASGADVVFMADDEEFIALNVREGKYVDNTRATALGYCTALEVALGGVSDKEVLVIGAGRVGSWAIKRLLARGARISVLEKDEVMAARARDRFGVTLIADSEKGIREAKAILNASPARIPGEYISEGTVISSPGVPYAFDEEGERKAGVIIHDPLQIGVAVMAVWAALYSHQAIHQSQSELASVEALQ